MFEEYLNKDKTHTQIEDLSEADQKKIKLAPIEKDGHGIKFSLTKF